MKDHLYIGECPAEEDCPTGLSPDQERRVCRQYIKAIQRVVGEPVDGARLAVLSNPHDFGSYLSVECYYDDDKPESIEYAMKCERECPSFWTEEDIRELAEAGIIITSSRDDQKEDE